MIFDESKSLNKGKSTSGEYTGLGKKGNPCLHLARILQYLECPQYLRKYFFPKHSDLQYAGLLNPLDCPHHMRADEEVQYREGVVLDRPTKNNKGSFVNCGISREVQIDKKLQTNVRVTVQMTHTKKEQLKYLSGRAVSPCTPRMNAGLYWGYTVRLADSLSKVFTECSISDKYDLIIGTSERGQTVDDLSLPNFQHLLLAFGGLKGLEASLDADDDLDEIDDPSLLFDEYINACPNQGSRTIRSEEAILITLSALRPKILSAVTPK